MDATPVAGGWSQFFPVGDWFFAAAAAGTVTAVWALGGPHRLPATLLIGALAGAYVLLCRPVFRGRSDRWGHAFLIVAFALFGGATYTDENSSWLLWALCPLVYMVIDAPAVAVPVGGAFVLLPALVQLGLPDGSVSHLVTYLPIAAVIVAGSWVISLWMERLVRESNERGRLIAELTASQAEVARLSHEAGTATERQRLAAEIHDTLAQGFTSILTLIQAAERDPAQAPRLLGLAAATARENLAEARAMVGALTPAALLSGTSGERSLADAIARQTARVGQETGLDATFDATGEIGSLPTAVDVVLLRAAQEALTNVGRHARAGSVLVGLTGRPDCVELTVRDDGAGFDPSVPPAGYGLAGLRGRVEQVGGAVQVSTGPTGTLVRVQVPPVNATVITVLLVDDHPVVRTGLRGVLEAEPDLTVVGEAGSGAEAVALATALDPDVVLMDLRMPGVDGVSATGRIRSGGAASRVLVLTTYETDADILRAVEAGATGYLLKDATPAELTDAVRAAARGETVLAPAVAGRLLRTVRAPTAAPTAREVEVLRLVARGLTNAEIGRELFIGEATVKTHLLRLFAKLDVSDRTAAVTTALDRGLL